MVRKTLIVIFIVCFGCNEGPDPSDLDLLNGYWEIEKVVFKNGQSKTYSLNTTIDYIEINEGKGFRKKVYPKFDGNYDTSNDTENFHVVLDKGNLKMVYKNKLSTWEEQLTAIDKNTFVVTNHQGTAYYYTRYEPIVTLQ